MKLVITVALFGVLFLSAGCTPAHALLSAKGYDVVRAHFADIPVPEGFKYLKDKSYRLEYDWKNVRHGRLFYRGFLTPDDVQHFYLEKMINANWTYANSSSGEKTIITFSKGSGETSEQCVVIIYTVKNYTIVEIRLDPVK